jgi:hypothetical protein
LIDALCIYQSGIEDRQSQVALMRAMRHIFEAAEKILVGLDEADPNFSNEKADDRLIRTVLNQLEESMRRCHRWRAMNLTSVLLCIDACFGKVEHGAQKHLSD